MFNRRGRSDDAGGSRRKGARPQSNASAQAFAGQLRWRSYHVVRTESPHTATGTLNRGWRFDDACTRPSQSTAASHACQICRRSNSSLRESAQPTAPALHLGRRSNGCVHAAQRTLCARSSGQWHGGHGGIRGRKIGGARTFRQLQVGRNHQLGRASILSRNRHCTRAVRPRCWLRFGWGRRLGFRRTAAFRRKDL